MPQKIYAKKDEVPEALREAAVETKDGKFVVWEEMGDGGKAALDKERTAREVAEKAQRAAEAKVTELEQTKQAAAAGLTEEKLKQLRSEIRADIEKEFAGKPLSELPESWKARNEANALSGDNRSLRLDNQVKALAAKNGVRAERIDAWWKQHSDKFDLTADGKPMVKDKPGTEVDKFIKDDLKKELPDFYVGTQAAGGGAGGLQKDGKQIVGTSADDVLKNPAAALTAAREAAA